MRFSGPTADTLVLFAAVFLAQRLLAVAGAVNPLVLTTPLAVNPWTILTSVYAHASVGHLLANVIALLVVGPLISRVTTRARFHAFFVAVGVIAGSAEVLVGGLFGGRVAVLGASGALFGLLGYLLAGNRLAAATLGRIRLSSTAQALLVVTIAGALTLATAAPGVALVAHFTGLCCGLLAGRIRLLHVDS